MSRRFWQKSSVIRVMRASWCTSKSWQRAGSFADPQRPIPDTLRRLLAAQGIDQLYHHQAQALDAARAGRDIVVVSGTASGKTLCYNLPILESCLADPQGARSTFFRPKRWHKTSSKVNSN